jgi:hypothetical protein
MQPPRWFTAISSNQYPSPRMLTFQSDPGLTSNQVREDIAMDLEKRPKFRILPYCTENEKARFGRIRRTGQVSVLVSMKSLCAATSVREVGRYFSTEGPPFICRPLFISIFPFPFCAADRIRGAVSTTISSGIGPRRKKRPSTTLVRRECEGEAPQIPKHWYHSHHVPDNT